MVRRQRQLVVAYSSIATAPSSRVMREARTYSRARPGRGLGRGTASCVASALLILPGLTEAVPKPTVGRLHRLYRVALPSFANSL